MIKLDIHHDADLFAVYRRLGLRERLRRAYVESEPDNISPIVKVCGEEIAKRMANWLHFALHGSYLERHNEISSD